MPERIYFSDLAERFGISGGVPFVPGCPAGPDSPEDGDAVVHPNVWRREGGEKLLTWLRENYRAGDVFEFDGHGDCWLMLAAMDLLRGCQLRTYIGVFDRTLPIEAYRTGPAPAEGQPCFFSLEEQGDDVLLTVHLDPDKGPFDMPFSEITAPEIPDGRNIYVRLDGRHLLFTFPLSLTYGTRCRSMIMDYSDECFCSVSNVPELSVGDLVASPFTN